MFECVKIHPESSSLSEVLWGLSQGLLAVLGQTMHESFLTFRLTVWGLSTERWLVACRVGLVQNDSLPVSV